MTAPPRYALDERARELAVALNAERLERPSWSLPRELEERFGPRFVAG